MKSPSTAILLFLSLNSLASIAQVIDLKRFTEPALQEGQCHTITDSKVYLADIKNPAHAKSVAHIISDLGEEVLGMMENTEKESYFFCKVKCNLKSETNLIWIAAKDENEKMKTDVNAFVCPGLSVENVPASPTLSIKTTVPSVFEAVMSPLPEIHFRLTTIGYKLTGPTVGKMIVDFYTALKAVHYAYSYANAPVYQEAASELATFEPESPDSWIQAKLRSKAVIEKSIEMKRSALDYTKSSDLVDLFFLINGRFLQYVD